MPPSSSPPSPTHTSGNVAPDGAHRRERRALAWGLGLSLVAHLLLVALYPLMMDRLTPDDPPPSQEEALVPLPAMEVVELYEPDEAPDPEEAEEEAAPQTEPPPLDLPAPDPSALEAEPAPALDEDEEAERRRALVELLTPQPGDPRLWAPLEEDYLELTDEERAQLMLHGMIRNWSDSVAVAAALSDAATDWTYTDDEGRRWGLSPGRLHLGDFSIPLPFQFSGPRTLLEDRMYEEWTIRDLTRGAAAQVIRETWAERARAIRERMDAERERRRDGGN